MKSEKLVLSDVKLSVIQKRAIEVTTPPEFIKTRKGKGGKTFTYVEGGYVVARLNAAFSPVGWDFEILHEEISGKEVWVRGKLTVIDHKNGWRVSKSQYGTKEIIESSTSDFKMPLGDALKSAATDCLKKCASYLGVALDVYWNQIDDDQNKLIKDPKGVERKETKTMFDKAKMMISTTTDFATLSEYDTKIKASDKYTAKQKEELSQLIQKQIDGNSNA